MGAVLTIGTVLGVLAPVAGSTAAWAGGPEHVKSTETGEMTVEAGEFCDFAFTFAGTFSDDAVIFPDKTIMSIKDQVAHINQDTGFTLTETDHFTVTEQPGQFKLVGIYWHLRNADGKIVVVHAGQMLFDGDGNVVKFTPNMNPDDAAVICPALGGHPA